MASELLERSKIQADVLVPVLKAFREELGTERANQIAWKALEGWRREIVREHAKALSGTGVERWSAGMAAGMPAIGDAVEFDTLKQDDAAWEFNITGCRFAQFFRELGEPELGFALLCSMDDTSAEEWGDGEVALKRTGTIMQGADHCDFRYALKKAGR